MVGDIDETIHQKTRLRMMSYLAAVGEADFLKLRHDLALTDGNLSIHSSILEKAGFVEVEKSFVGKKPKTLYRITAAGRKAFADYVAELESVLRGGAGG